MAIHQDPLSLKYVKEQTEKLCLEAFRQLNNGYNKLRCHELLKCVQQQTLEICQEANRKDYRSLEFSKFQYENMCLEAVKSNGLSLVYVKEQTESIKYEAVELNPFAIYFVEKPSEYLIFKYWKQYNDLDDDNGDDYDFIRDSIDFIEKYADNDKKSFINRILKNNQFFSMEPKGMLFYRLIED